MCAFPNSLVALQPTSAPGLAADIPASETVVRDEIANRHAHY
jgi:hypothetical protein